jgi:hypothetical protein
VERARRRKRHRLPADAVSTLVRRSDASSPTERYAGPPCPQRGAARKQAHGDDRALVPSAERRTLTVMSETSRNAPCPCGSGRKFKRCCAEAFENPAAISRKHDKVGARIQEWAGEHHDAEIQAALEEIIAGREDLVLSHVDVQLIGSWLYNDRELADGGTAAQRYAARQDLDPDDRDIAARIAAARLALLRVARAMPGRWIELRDLTGGHDLVRVVSHDVSRSARPGAVIVGRMMDGPPALTLWGPVGFLNRETSRELDDLLKPYTDSLGLRAQPTEISAAMQAASREILVMLPPALRHTSPRQQAAA